MNGRIFLSKPKFFNTSHVFFLPLPEQKPPPLLFKLDFEPESGFWISNEPSCHPSVWKSSFLLVFFSQTDCSPPQPVSGVGVDPLFVRETHEPPLFRRCGVGFPGTARAVRFNGAAVQEKAMCLEYMHLRNGILVSSPLGVTVCLIRLSSCDCKQTCDYSKMVAMPPPMALTISGQNRMRVAKCAPPQSQG